MKKDPFDLPARPRHADGLTYAYDFNAHASSHIELVENSIVSESLAPVWTDLRQQDAITCGLTSPSCATRGLKLKRRSCPKEVGSWMQVPGPANIALTSRI